AALRRARRRRQRPARAHRAARGRTVPAVTSGRCGATATVVVVMGVSGSGKTTVGRALAARLGAEFHDADDYHPQANVEKMLAGVPLTEADRKPWLERLRGAIDSWLETGTTAVLACSALTARSRAILGTGREGVRLVFL